MLAARLLELFWFLRFMKLVAHLDAVFSLFLFRYLIIVEPDIFFRTVLKEKQS